MPNSGTARFAWMVLFLAMGVTTCVFLRTEISGRQSTGLRTEPRTADFPIDRPIRPFLLTNQFGRPMTASSLTGAVTVFDVIFTQCSGQCHQLSFQMREIQKQLPAGMPAQLMSLTADPEFDTPEVLEKYGRRYGYQTNNWFFLTGPKRDVYQLAIQELLFSVVEKPEVPRSTVDDRFIHTTAYALVDRRGHLRGVVQGELTNAVEEIVRRVKVLAGEN